MQCSCGGDASTKTATKKLNKALTGKLSFYECNKCFQVSGAVLSIGETVVAEDSGAVAEARQAFNDLTIASAEALSQDAVNALIEPVSVPARSAQATQQTFEF